VKLANYLGVSTLADLRAEIWENIIKAGESATLGLPSPSGYVDDITVDGYYLLDTGPSIFATGRQNDVPLVIGMNGEDITFVFSGTKAFVPIIKQRSKVFVYLFDHVPTGWKSKGIFNAFHGLDVAYEFGFQPWVSFFWNTLFFPFPTYCGIFVPQDPGLDSKDDYVAEAMMTMWTQFAATGNPSVRGLVNWPAYDPVTDQYLYIDDPLQVKSGFSTLVEPTANHCGL
jgi:para-nitrobenzyl esterase